MSSSFSASRAWLSTARSTDSRHSSIISRKARKASSDSVTVLSNKAEPLHDADLARARAE